MKFQKTLAYWPFLKSIAIVNVLCNVLIWKLVQEYKKQDANNNVSEKQALLSRLIKDHLEYANVTNSIKEDIQLGLETVPSELLNKLETEIKAVMIDTFRRCKEWDKFKTEMIRVKNIASESLAELLCFTIAE